MIAMDPIREYAHGSQRCWWPSPASLCLQARHTVWLPVSYQLSNDAVCCPKNANLQAECVEQGIQECFSVLVLVKQIFSSNKYDSVATNDWHSFRAKAAVGK